MDNEEVDFGFDRIPVGEKPAKVARLFDEASENYDLMNDLMSMFLHRLWKGYLVDCMTRSSVRHLLDLAGGTGDIAFRALGRRAVARVTVCDLSFGMADYGRNREEALMYPDRLSWSVGDGASLPFGDASFDVCCISFGLRNTARPERVIKEAYRILEPGGAFYCLEFARASNPLASKLYDRYAFRVLPGLGDVVAGNRYAYRYLAESIKRFGETERIAEWMADVGFERRGVKTLLGGVVALHSGVKYGFDVASAVAGNNHVG